MFVDYSFLFVYLIGAQAHYLYPHRAIYARSSPSERSFELGNSLEPSVLDAVSWVRSLQSVRKSLIVAPATPGSILPSTTLRLPTTPPNLSRPSLTKKTPRVQECRCLPQLRQSVATKETSTRIRLKKAVGTIYTQMKLDRQIPLHDPVPRTIIGP